MQWQNTVTIDAPVQRVWELTTDVTKWPLFTPTMQSVDRLDDGPLRVGSSARIKQPGQTPAVWTVTELSPGKGFAWQTKRMGMTMTGTHRLAEVGGKCHNTLVIDIAGPGARLFGLLLGGAFRKSLALENAGFKERAEKPE